MRRFLNLCLVACAAAAGCSLGPSGPLAPGAGGAVLRRAAEFDWRPPTQLPPGADYQLMREDPATHGIQAVVRFPPGYSVPEHTHPSAETLVVLRGSLLVRAEGRARLLHAGDYALLPAGLPHALEARSWFRKTWFVAATDGPYELKTTEPDK